ncbi:hypothetical protein WOLCODRAFT_153951 [Wolfiporia cocos MD-104 SS10]|uniref:Uncharacterized protein n=1 Tax=Wolfiporia cocos (strain MD-104) TaxID=742152 RepID=A0A2H3JYC1_WOLCO|nr:hypothetical protein WOLCODRAFT_153951 [Wolfiporia cocos MD-104 SS10]
MIGSNNSRPSSCACEWPKHPLHATASCQTPSRAPEDGTRGNDVRSVARPHTPTRSLRPRARRSSHLAATRTTLHTPTCMPAPCPSTLPRPQINGTVRNGNATDRLFTPDALMYPRAVPSRRSAHPDADSGESSPVQRYLYLYARTLARSRVRTPLPGKSTARTALGSGRPVGPPSIALIVQNSGAWPAAPRSCLVDTVQMHDVTSSRQRVRTVN